MSSSAARRHGTFNGRRPANILAGTLDTAVEIAKFFDSALFYQIVVVTEIALTVAIVWHAVRWPRDTAA